MDPGVGDGKGQMLLKWKNVVIVRGVCGTWGRE